MNMIRLIESKYRIGNNFVDYRIDKYFLSMTALQDGSCLKSLIFPTVSSFLCLVFGQCLIRERPPAGGQGLIPQTVDLSWPHSDANMSSWLNPTSQECQDVLNANTTDKDKRYIQVVLWTLL